MTIRRRWGQAPDQSGGRSRPVQQVLVVVEHDEQPPLPHEVHDLTQRIVLTRQGEAQTIGDAGRDQGRVAQGCQGHEDHAVREVGCESPHRLGGKAGLPGPPRATDGEEADIGLSEEPRDLCEFEVAPDEGGVRGGGCRNRVGAPGSQSRRVGVATSGLRRD